MRLFDVNLFHLFQIGRVLDLLLPGVDGFEVCRRLRRKSSYVPVLMLTAKSSEIDRVVGLEIGADDYVTKPFSIRELLARVKAIFRRVEELTNDTISVDTGCLAAFTPSIDYSIERAGNLKSMFFGGEGLFLAILRGTGVAYLQSLPFSRMADRILQHAPRAGGSRKGEGSILGGLGDLIDGN